ncbi:MAG TPA: hypothetical protein VFF67_02660 [Thermoplasmata archaeon]|nr:hypothetical protein [Thermoplasmata archaeon]
MSRRRAPGSPSEIQGFLEGVEHRRREVAPDDVAIGRGIEEVRAAIARRDWSGAHERLVEIDEKLAMLRPEGALRERPRGLVSYTVRGPAEGPPAPEEDPLTNRILLVQRLLAVRKADGWEVDRWVAQLRAAEEARRAGDLPVARRLVDRVHADLEALGNRGARTP